MTGWGRRLEQTSSSPIPKHQARFAHKFLQMPAVRVDMGRGKGHARLGDATSRSHSGALAAVGRLASFLGALKSGGEDMTSLGAANCNATARHKEAARSLERTSFGGAWGHGAIGRGNSWGTRGSGAQQSCSFQQRVGPWSHRARQTHGARGARWRSKRADFGGARAVETSAVE